MLIAKVSYKRCAESLDDLLKDQYLNLQNERYEITDLGIHYLEEMTKRDKRGRQLRSQLTGRSFDELDRFYYKSSPAQYCRVS